MKARLIIISAVIAVALVGVGLLFAPGLVDWTPNRARIAATIEQLTGTTVSIAGEVDFRFLPSPRYVASDITLSDPAGEHGTDLLTIRTLDISLDSWALLVGRTHVNAVSLLGPVLTVERFDRDFIGVVAGLAPWAERPFTISEAAIRDGTIVYRDMLSGDEHRIERLNATLRSDDPRGPHRLTGTLAWRDRPLEIDASLGELDARGTAQLDAGIGLAGTGSTAEISGRVHLGPAPVFRGALAVTSGNAIGDLRFLAGLDATDAADTGADPRPLRLSASLSAGPDGAEATGLALEFGSTRLEGDARVTPAPDFEVGLNLALARVNLGSLEDVTRAGEAIAGALFDSAQGFSLPHDMGATLTLASDAVDVGGSLVRHLRLEGVLDGGAFTVRHFTAELPGGTLTRVAGTLHAVAGRPRFVGEIDVASDKLRTLFGWLDLPVDAVPPDRLRTGTFRSEIDVTPDRLDLPAWRIGLDATRVDGGLSALFGPRPAFGLGLFADRINLDPYLPILHAAAGTNAADDGRRERVAEALERFDANLLVEVNEATVRGTVLEKVRLDAGIDHGRVDLRDLSVGNTDGGSYSLSGTLGKTTPDAVDVRLEVRNGSIPGLVRLLDIPLAKELAALDRFAISSTMTGTTTGLDVKGTATSAGGTVTAAGRIVPGSPPEFLLKLKADHPDAGALLHRLTGRSHAPPEHLGQGTANITLASRIDRGVDIQSVLHLGAARLALDGTADPFAPDPALDVRVQFSHSDLAELIRIADPGFAPAHEGPGALDITAHLEGTGSGLEVRDIDARVGNAGIRGTGRIDRTGPRPSVTLALASGPLDLDAWLPEREPEESGAIAPLAPDRGGWSHEPWDFGALRVLDLALDLEAQRAQYGASVIEDLVLAATLLDGTVEVTRLRGRLRDGTVEGRAQLVTGGIPELELEVRVTGTRLDHVPEGEHLPVSGLLEYSVSLSGQGRSQFELVSGLQGQGTAVLTEGIINGIDLPAASARLPEIERTADLLTMLQEATSGGATPFGRIAGSFTVRNGILTSRDLIMEAPSTSGTAVMVLDLPVRELDIRSELWLTDLPQAPPLGVRLVGPMTAPRVELDVERMQQLVLQRMKRTGVLQRLATQPEAAPAADGQQSGNSKPGPGTGRTDPDPAKPEPEDAGSAPKDAGPGPDAGDAEPGTPSREPQAAGPRSNGTVPEPETAAPEPKSTTPKPETATTEPEPTTTGPGSSTTRPESSPPDPDNGKSGATGKRRDFQSILEGLLE
ncbi:MAG: AsmA family protein [Alphaproteobacteria bacterium]|nr:AsmA family protein [Alphaproteobacteria bacterium]